MTDQVRDSSGVVSNSVISFKKQQSMAHTLPSREFRWRRSHAEYRERRRFSNCNLPWLPFTFSNRTNIRKDLVLANVKVDSQAGVGKGKGGKYRKETELLIPSKTVNHAE